MPSQHIDLLAPALAPNAILSLRLPHSASNDFISSAKVAKKAQVEETQHKAKGLVDRSVVKQYEFINGPEHKEVGVVQRLSALAVGGEEHNRTYAAADSNHRVSVFDFRFSSSTANKVKRPSANHAKVAAAGEEDVSEDEEGVNDDDEESDDGEDQDDDRDVEVKEQYQVRPGRKTDAWVGMELFDDAIISSLSSGTLTYQPRSSTLTPQTRRLPSPLTCFQTVRSSSSSSGTSSLVVPSHFIAAGKEVEVSLWDLERTLAVKSTNAGNSTEAVGAGAAGQQKKRKKDQLEVGEVWRAKNVPHNHLNLRIPVHHLSATVLPNSNADGTHIATGTKSGHVRRYDTRQREVAANWKCAREGGGVKLVQAGVNEHELFFGDTTSLLGALDLRTGKVLYGYPQQTCTTSHVLPLPQIASSSAGKDTIGMVSLASDATLRLHSVSAPPREAKHNVTKGAILGGIPGIGLGNPVFGGYGNTRGERDDMSDVDSEDGDGEQGGDVWDDMAVIDDVSEGSDDSEEEEDDMEEQVKKKRKAQTKPKPREK